MNLASQVGRPTGVMLKHNLRRYSKIHACLTNTRFKEHSIPIVESNMTRASFFRIVVCLAMGGLQSVAGAQGSQDCRALFIQMVTRIVNRCSGSPPHDMYQPCLQDDACEVVTAGKRSDGAA